MYVFAFKKHASFDSEITCLQYISQNYMPAFPTSNLVSRVTQPASLGCLCYCLGVTSYVLSSPSDQKYLLAFGRWSACMSVCVHACMRACMHVDKLMHVSCMHAYFLVCICICLIYACINQHACAHVHQHMHAGLHMLLGFSRVSGQFTSNSPIV